MNVTDLLESENDLDAVALGLFYLQEINQENWYSQRDIRQKTPVSSKQVAIPRQLDRLVDKELAERQTGGQYRLTPAGLHYCVEVGAFDRPEAKFHEYITIDLDREVYAQSIPEHGKYIKTIIEINKTYRNGSLTATALLMRKLCERLLYDILKEYYPGSDVHMFYDADNGRNYGLNQLIENFKDSRSELQVYSEPLEKDQKFNQYLQTLHAVRRVGNTSAHSIWTDLDQSDFDEQSDEVNELFENLFGLLRQVSISS